MLETSGLGSHTVSFELVVIKDSLQLNLFFPLKKGECILLQGRALRVLVQSGHFPVYVDWVQVKTRDLEPFILVVNEHLLLDVSLATLS